VQRIIVFDSDPTGLVCHEPGNPDGEALRNWMFKEWSDGATIIVPAIIDYEVRRELIRKEFTDSLKRLDAFYADKKLWLLSIKDSAMQTAARLWAEARRRGEPTAHEQAVDCDVILSAQAMDYCTDADDWWILTENVGHIARYVGARARSRRAVVGDWWKSSGTIVS
jgi:hypothetical protein